MVSAVIIWRNKQVFKTVPTKIAEFRPTPTSENIFIGDNTPSIDGKVVITNPFLGKQSVTNVNLFKPTLVASQIKLPFSRSQAQSFFVGERESFFLRGYVAKDFDAIRRSAARVNYSNPDFTRLSGLASSHFYGFDMNISGVTVFHRPLVLVKKVLSFIQTFLHSGFLGLHSFPLSIINNRLSHNYGNSKHSEKIGNDKVDSLIFFGREQVKGIPENNDGANNNPEPDKSKGKYDAQAVKHFIIFIGGISFGLFLFGYGFHLFIKNNINCNTKKA
jgi:hypothetical protein